MLKELDWVWLAYMFGEGQCWTKMGPQGPTHVNNKCMRLNQDVLAITHAHF